MIRCVFERQEQLHLHCRTKTYLCAALSIHLRGPCASRNLLVLHGPQPTPVFQGPSHSPLKVPEPDPLVTGQGCLSEVILCLFFLIALLLLENTLNFGAVTGVCSLPDSLRGADLETGDAWGMEAFCSSAPRASHQRGLLGRGLESLQPIPHLPLPLFAWWQPSARLEQCPGTLLLAGCWYRTKKVCSRASSLALPLFSA